MSTIAAVSQVFLPNGDVVSKYDLVAIIHVYNHHYFHVYRRYNNMYEFVIQDKQGDLFFHMDCPVRDTLQQLLCISPEKTRMLYVIEAFSFRHNGVPPTMVDDIPDMFWSDIHFKWQAIAVNFGGILQEFHQPQSAFLPASSSSSSSSSSYIFNPPVEGDYDEFFQQFYPPQNVSDSPMVPQSSLDFHKKYFSLQNESESPMVPASAVNLYKRFFSQMNAESPCYICGNQNCTCDRCYCDDEEDCQCNLYSDCDCCNFKSS